MTPEEKKILEKKWKAFQRKKFKNVSHITREMLEEARFKFIKMYDN